MAKQRIFKTIYTQNLLDKLQLPDGIENYRQDKFDYDEDAVLIIPNIESVSSVGLLDRMQPANDFESSKALYLALKDLTPIQAADPRLWAYLSHVDLYPYMIRRWKEVYIGESDKCEYIVEHWFVKTPSQQSLMRNALSGLWWAAYLSYEENAQDPFELTKIFYKDLDLPTRTIGTYRIGRHKPAVRGLLRFIKDNPDIMNTHYEDRVRFILKHLNVLGGVKPLSFFDEDFFYKECESISTELRRI